MNNRDNWVLLAIGVSILVLAIALMVYSGERARATREAQNVRNAQLYQECLQTMRDISKQKEGRVWEGCRLEQAQ